MMNTKRTHGIRAWQVVMAFAILLAPTIATAEDDTKAEAVKHENPPFRTNFGMHLSVGGHSCIGGGSRYAKCFGADDAWDTSWGLAGGLQVRPFNRVSFGVDFAVMNMRYHQDTSNKWRDLTIGPLVRYHQPIKIRKLYFEPNIGLQFGWVRGTFNQRHWKHSNADIDYNHEHLGPFLAMVFGLDFFPLPKVGVGLDFRIIRTFYTEVCFESTNGTACRGIDDKAVVERYDLTAGGLPSEMGIAKYPWKLFYGVHGMYYF